MGMNGKVRKIDEANKENGENEKTQKDRVYGGEIKG